MLITNPTCKNKRSAGAEVAKARNGAHGYEWWPCLPSGEPEAAVREMMEWGEMWAEGAMDREELALLLRTST